jgi:hypothetical protein
MATVNREAIEATMEVTIDSLRSELDQIETPVLEEAGLVDRIGPRRTSALDMTSMRRYNMMREWIGERDMSHDRRVFKSRIYTRKFEDSISIPMEKLSFPVLWTERRSFPMSTRTSNRLSLTETLRRVSRFS